MHKIRFQKFGAAVSVVFLMGATHAAAADEFILTDEGEATLAAYTEFKGAALVLSSEALAVPERAAIAESIVIDPDTGLAKKPNPLVQVLIDGAETHIGNDTKSEPQGANNILAHQRNSDVSLGDFDATAPILADAHTQTIATGSVDPAIFFAPSSINWALHGDRLFFSGASDDNLTFQNEREIILTADERFGVDTSEVFLLGPNAAAHIN